VKQVANKKPNKELENEGNGQNVPGIQELLQAIAHNQQELSDRLSDIEEATGKKDDSATIVKLANMYFKPEDKYLPDLSWISPLAARPLAEAMALDEMTSPRVRSGEISLNRLVIENWLHFQRGVRGRLLGIGADAMREQISGEATKGEENMPDFEAGKE
jgi:hypothetical protein